VSHKGGTRRRDRDSPIEGGVQNTKNIKEIGILKQKPVWMSDAEYEKQQQSIQRAVEKPVTEKKIQDFNNNINNSDNIVNEPMASEDINVKIKYLKNLKAEGKDEIVRDFYNTQTFNSRQNKRTESPIYRLRSFNNCIKYILVNKYGKPNGSILDLGCGKGGDLAKWGMIDTRQYVGIDLSDESIREAIKRYRNGRYKFEAVFATGDAYKNEIPTILKDFKHEQVSYLQFDNVSMQFCMHYAFSSEESVESMLTNVSKSLKVGGMFIGTIPSSDFIKWKLKKLKEGETKWGNSLYSVTFPDLTCYNKENNTFIHPFGNVYNYFLKDAVEDVPEYVVPFEKFRSMCEDHGLELRYKKNFFDMFNKEMSQYFHQLPGPLIQSLRQEDGSYGVSGEEREACSFYLAFAFERV
jgi:SAM-dependent methyltransferase